MEKFKLDELVDGAIRDMGPGDGIGEVANRQRGAGAGGARPPGGCEKSAAAHQDQREAPAQSTSQRETRWRPK
ncbi:hypothetical protein QG37_08348 [Candidozyma auris]|uniref:Uncharacterized protein n=1 Tax=Candidozyma auris TaxID=498019 RepID=A0A0L0NMQ9_CANAR|nr:hypothetical protein QG37_08348 [[Candida] auris]